MGRELGRHDRGDGYTDVTVALGADHQGHLIVPTDLIDGPGYQDMLNARATKYSGLVALRDEGTPL
jgi:hypothetical protein